MQKITAQAIANELLLRSDLFADVRKMTKFQANKLKTQVDRQIHCLESKQGKNKLDLKL